ncbi:MAG: class I SAM-dependent methyltransferase [Lachnospiraceae bacterium]|nr:class I SAM-dependent methyltransferase [Lachnospiraceae bacterium]
MVITDKRIDEGKAFDWGKTSEYYAKYRDIYPDVFYQKVADRGFCVSGQRVLDLGTGTGVLPRNMYKYGAEWTGIDISPEQISQAKRLALEAGMDIDFKAVSAEKMDFSSESFDVLTACQCFWYFDHAKVAPEFSRILKNEGRVVILYMAWLPFEDEIAGRSEELICKYNPSWSGGGETRHPIYIPDVMYDYFEMVDREEYDVKVAFTRESWHGRIFASRGIGASLSPEDLASWDKEHRAFLANVPDEFEVLHYAAIAVLKKK